MRENSPNFSQRRASEQLGTWEERCLSLEMGQWLSVLGVLVKVFAITGAGRTINQQRPSGGAEALTETLHSAQDTHVRSSADRLTLGLHLLVAYLSSSFPSFLPSFPVLPPFCSPWFSSYCAFFSLFLPHPVFLLVPLLLSSKHVFWFVNFLDSNQLRESCSCDLTANSVWVEDRGEGEVTRESVDWWLYFTLTAPPLFPVLISPILLPPPFLPHGWRWVIDGFRFDMARFTRGRQQGHWRDLARCFGETDGESERQRREGGCSHHWWPRCLPGFPVWVSFSSNCAPVPSFPLHHHWACSL